MAVWTSPARSFILFLRSIFQAMTKKSSGSRKGLTPLGVVFLVLGVVLFAYFVRKAGVGQIVDGIKRLGAGFVLILVISAVRQIARSLAWMLCMEAPHRLRFRDAFRA